MGETEVAVGDEFVQARVIRNRKSAVQYVAPFVVTILQQVRATCVPPVSRGFSGVSSRLAYRFNPIRHENDRQNPWEDNVDRAKNLRVAQKRTSFFARQASIRLFCNRVPTCRHASHPGFFEQTPHEGLRRDAFVARELQ